MMKPYTNPPLMIVLVIVAFLAITACNLFGSGVEAHDRGNQPIQPDSDEGLQPEEQEPDLIQPQQTGNGETTGNINCTDTHPHPVGQNIAVTFDVSYQQVMTWFCSGYSFENILIALETSEAVEVPADTLLQMLAEKEWEEIWIEIGFIDGQ